MLHIFMFFWGFFVFHRGRPNSCTTGCPAIYGMVPLLGQFTLRLRSHCRGSIDLMHSCTTSWTSASSLFPVCHYWPNL